VDLKIQIGHLLAQYRKQKNISQERLAYLTDMHPDYIGKIERGLRIPSLASLLKILDALKVKYSEFFDQLS